jgi:hypothetical protein
MSVFEKLAKSWGSPLVARSEIASMTGGVLHPRTMANLDAKGDGPGKLIVGGRVCYEVDKLVDWLEKRTRCVDPRTINNIKEKSHV